MSYTEVTVTGYNSNPPEDDGTVASSNEVEWQKHLDKIGAPLKTAIESTQTNITAAINQVERSLKGQIWGLQLSNNSSDATNDIDISAGTCRDASNAVSMSIASAITKRIDATWSVGSGNGGLDGGSPAANDVYHVFAIYRSDTGVSDILFSASPTSPTMPTNYDYKRRIGAFIRESGVNVPFWQDGDVFLLQTRVTLYSNPSTAAYALASLASFIPTGLRVEPILSGIALQGGGNSCFFDIGDARDSAEATTVRLVYNRGDDDASVDQNNAGNFNTKIFSNTSAQIYVEISRNGGTLNIYGHGWIDQRDRFFDATV